MSPGIPAEPAEQCVPRQEPVNELVVGGEPWSETRGDPVHSGAVQACPRTGRLSLPVFGDFAQENGSGNSDLESTYQQKKQ